MLGIGGLTLSLLSCHCHRGWCSLGWVWSTQKQLLTCPSPQPVHRVALAPAVPTCVHAGKEWRVTRCRGLASVLPGGRESTVSMVSVSWGMSMCTVH